LYLAARNFPNIKTTRSADFYLNAAVQSLYAANCINGQGGFDCLITVGLMDGTVWREMLRALIAEGDKYATDAATVTSLMRNRTLQWQYEDQACGSEFAWDTTGQEEVSVWGMYFNASSDLWMQGNLNERTVNFILAFMSSVPTFAYHGAAYGMGDFSNNAKWMVNGGWEREGGHYRSGLNSIPVIERYRVYPDDFFLLLVGIAGITAPMPNIDATGATSMAYHTYPFIHEHDPNSGDHGLGWFGSSLNAGSYLHIHPDLGILCFLCDAVGTSITKPITIIPRDTYHIRAYIAPIGLWLVAEAGMFHNITYDSTASLVTICFESSQFVATTAGMATIPYDLLRLRIETPSFLPYSYTFLSPTNATIVRGAYTFNPVPDINMVTIATLQIVNK
jgi:Family of unknown function (DUF5695)